jgi:4-hydroxy-tetrahydrodipicolinate synthase
MRTPFSGVGTALITPFRQDGTLDEAAVRRLARRQIDAGIHFLSPCGTTGEAPTLTHREKLRVVELVVEEAAGKVPVLAGAGGYDTREVIELAKDLERIGVDGLLSVTPYYNKPTPEGLYQHFRAIADATPLKIVLYNVPGRTGVNLDVQTVVRLSSHPNLVAVKEASANVVQMCDIVASTPDDFMLLSGDDPLIVAVMGIGGRGIICVSSNQAPAECAQIVELCERGEGLADREVEGLLMSVFEAKWV